MAIDLAGAVALVVGGANGIGAAAARRLALRGGRVVVADGTASARPYSRSRAMERRAVVRATSKVSKISDSVGMRELWG